MSLFVDKWTSPFNTNNSFGQDDFFSTAFGEFRLGPDFCHFGETLEAEEDCLSLKMKLRNGSVATERGFYDHFDSIFHDRSRRHDLRTAVSDSAKRRSPQTAGKGKEYIIPIKVETSTKCESKSPQTSFGNSRACRSTASNGAVSKPDSPERVIEIPITRECSDQTEKTKRDKSRSPILPQSSKHPSSYKVLTPTTEGDRSISNKIDDSIDIELDGDIFFLRSQNGPRRQEQAQKPESDIEVVEIEDDDSFRSLCRKPLRHYQNTSSASSQKTVLTKRQSEPTADKLKIRGATSGKDDVPVTSKLRYIRNGSEKESEKGSTCCNPGPVDAISPPSYPIYDYLKPNLAAQGRQIDYTRGDGNCFFRAISRDVYGSEDYHAECRQAVCDLIHCNPDVFRQYIDHSTITAHVGDMRVPGTWATTCEIYATATLLGREIYILVPSPPNETEYHWLLFSPRTLKSPALGGSLVDVRQEGGDGCYLTLCHTNANHYDHVMPVSASCNCRLAPPSLNGVTMMLDLTSAEQDEWSRTSTA